MRKKRVLSAEHKRKIGAAHLGKKRVFSEEARRNIREAAAKRRGVKRGPRPDWIKKKISEATRGVKKTITGPNSSWFTNGHITVHSKETREKIGKAHRGKKVDPKVVEKIANKLRGRKTSEETRAKQREAQRKRWEGAAFSSLRRNKLHQIWIRSVKERDGNKCMICGKTENIHAHHIKPWKTNPELRYELSNGISLCSSCHTKEERRLFPFAPWNRGRKASDEARKKMSESAKGRIPWNKGRKNGTS